MLCDPVCNWLYVIEREKARYVPTRQDPMSYMMSRTRPNDGCPPDKHPQKSDLSLFYMTLTMSERE